MPTPDRTSLEEIVTAGAAVLEAHGPAGLTMAAVAAKVGVRAPSLYKRVRDRDALVGLIVAASIDDLTARLGVAEPTLDGLARTYRAFAHARPEGYRLLLASRSDPESLARVVTPVLRIAAELVGEQDTLDAARMITAWVTGFISMELLGAFRLDGDLERAFDFGLARLELALAPTG